VAAIHIQTEDAGSGRRATAARLVALLVVAGAGATLAEEPAPGRPTAYTFGVLPMLPAARLEAAFAPIGGELRRALGREIRYRSAATYEQFADRLARQEFDIAHVQPLDYVRFAAPGGYLPLAARNDVLAAVAVVPDESPIATPQQLAGAVVALPPAMAVVTTLGQATLLASGIDLRTVTFRHFDDHHSCIHQAVIGDAAACFTGLQSARLYEAKTGRKLRVIARSAAIPQTLFVVHRRVPERDREIILRTLLDTRLKGLDPDLAAFLTADAGRPFVPIRDADYDVVRGIWRTVEGGR